MCKFKYETIQKSGMHPRTIYSGLQNHDPVTIWKAESSFICYNKYLKGVEAEKSYVRSVYGMKTLCNRQYLCG